MADALFATVMAREFYCQCPNDPKHPCTAEIVTVPAGQVISGVDVKIVMHVIIDQATLDATADNPGYLDGHGVISADHVRDIAARPETVQRPMGNKPAPAPVRAEPQPEEETPKPKRPNVYARGPQNPPAENLPADCEGSDDSVVVATPFPQVVPLPSTQPGDSYRPSVVLDTFLRIRDVYCVWPGCEHKAWGADLDHTCEYNHNDPEAGGCTHPSEMKTLCRFHHLLKTYSAETKRSGARPVDWLDDQYPDPETGRMRLIFTTPERRHYYGPGWTGDDLFPTLRLIVFDNQRGSPSPPLRTPSPSRPQQADRQQSRTAAKHARRQQERLANRRQREREAARRLALGEERGRNEPPPTF